VFLVGAGVVYSGFILIEARMSPQFNQWIYGYQQSDFVQTIRFGGYRPKVFMRHGINVSMFIMMTVLAAAGLTRAKLRVWNVKAVWWLAYLGVILLVCKSAGSVVYALVVAPLILFVSPKKQARFAIIIATLAAIYPIFRLLDLVPTQAIVDFFTATINEERALSLGFRLDTESSVVANAREHLWFGWGGYARGFLFDDSVGRMTSVIDGFWLVELCSRGLIGVACVFGLLLTPVVRAVRQLRHARSMRDQYLLATLTLMVAIYIFDLVPNSSISADLTMLAGALQGLVPSMFRVPAAKRPAPEPEKVEDAALVPSPI
jgi:hypothetical protein